MAPVASSCTSAITFRSLSASGPARQGGPGRLLQQLVDDFAVLAVLPLRRGEGAAAGRLLHAVEKCRRHTGDAVVLGPGLGRRVGQRVGGRDVYVVPE